MSPPIAAWVTVALFGLAACGGSGDGGHMTENESTGTAAGAAGGAAAAAMLMAAGPVGIAVGAVSGAMKGNRVGSFLDGDAKKRAAAAAVQAAAAPAGHRVTWEKSDLLYQTEASGWAKAIGRRFRDAKGRTCRRVEESATQKDRTEHDVITLCRGSKGWAPVETAAAAEPPKPP